MSGEIPAAKICHVARRILIVDDSESFRRTVSVLLAARGFELLGSVPDGEAALAAVAGDCPDGILLDINLPGRDGFAVATAIAAAYPAVRIVLTSSETEDVPGAVLKTCGATAFVPKTELATADLRALFDGTAPQS
ncbi:MAG: response regulator [Kitasatospora sp.]|nr:response regulator [Kitasatospora sp.]